VECSKCGSEEVEWCEVIEIIEQVDEDEDYDYYTAVCGYECLSCGNTFEVEEDYKERKKEQ